MLRIVSGSALLFALAAAVVHAGWNLLLAGERDAEAATAVALPLAVLLFAPAVAATWRLDGAAVPYVAASAALELAYFALLAAAYRRGELSVVYPVARGSAPVLVLAISLAALGVSLSAASVAGVMAIAVGVFLVRGGAQGAGLQLVLGLAIGATIAGYTLIDRDGVQHAAPLTYIEVVLAGPAVAYAVYIGRLRGGAAMRSQLRPRTALIAVGTLGAYLLVLAALRRAPAAPVAAVRELSVVLATVAAAVFLREPVSRGRLAGAALVAGGVAAIALG
jgi:drug/metabolite transporter (DMT)-like permease